MSRNYGIPRAVRARHIDSYRRFGWRDVLGLAAMVATVAWLTVAFLHAIAGG